MLALHRRPTASPGPLPSPDKFQCVPVSSGATHRKDAFMKTATQAVPQPVSPVTDPTAGQDAAIHDIVDTAIAAGSFGSLVNAIKAADLVATLKGAGPFTLCAPTDDAFRKLPAGTLDGLLKDKAKLASILTYHVVSGKVLAKDAKAGDVKSVQGGMLAIALPGNGVTINSAKILKTDIEASNGVIHSIDTVLMPS